MHVYFSGIGGTGIGPLALIALEAGYTVSGSDVQESQYTHYLEEKGISLSIGQTREAIERLHQDNPIDWFVYTSALDQHKDNHPELKFVREMNIKSSKRDEFLAKIIADNKLQLIAVSGTNGKTTTTSMIIWLCKNLNIPISYSLGAKISFGDMGYFDKNSKYFIYECDEYDKNFLHFYPKLSVITSIAWDHQDIYPTIDSYNQAFLQFIDQSEEVILFKKDAKLLSPPEDAKISILEDSGTTTEEITLKGLHNRQNATIAIEAVRKISGQSVEKLIQIINSFPGTNRRFEKIADSIYSDYAHTPEKIAATLQMAQEINQNVVVVYEPHNNDRQKSIIHQYYDLFENTKHVYWLPTYVARKDGDIDQLQPADFMKELSRATHAEPAQLDDTLKNAIMKHQENGDLILCLSAGGGGSLDEWIRKTCNNGEVNE
jgi:UDP-N-acetylmuramate--alanine ligase